MTINFIDVFAGCGGLSLGLSEAGCKGVLAIEKSPLAFETLRYNLIDGSEHKFNWPDWLPRSAMTCESLIEEYQADLTTLSGAIDLIVGGPPCQGFSTAGKRNPDDPRNAMTDEYLRLIKLISPQFIAIENVSGYNMHFKKSADNPGGNSYADYISEKLENLGYDVSRGLINCSDFGVPQNRIRYIILCSKKKPGQAYNNLFEKLVNSRRSFLNDIGLPLDKKTTVADAIEDLSTFKKALEDNLDSGEKNFKQLQYCEPEIKNPYLRLMRKRCGNTAPNSLRLANHRPKTIEYFKLVQSICRPGYSMNVAERAQAGTRKHSTTVLNKNQIAPTITTLPDDVVHYAEPRILTARENARLQSFPDWFEFRGKYTTGGTARKNECPRYTQIGNAVPPLLAQAIGALLKNEALNITKTDRMPRAPSRYTLETKEQLIASGDLRQ